MYFEVYGLEGAVLNSHSAMFKSRRRCLDYDTVLGVPGINLPRGICQPPQRHQPVGQPSEGGMAGEVLRCTFSLGLVTE